ncbi:porin [Mycoplana dimorpha]|uniref:Porin n=1 Tax=Mycoplana dimorpha TaxID=28320 RepID=A0A2T5BI95_MYCDI|nr:porin [Mycoplana dimorpha]PTM98714.1 porin-like protein [Mycoplana dimorpha]
MNIKSLLLGSAAALAAVSGAQAADAIVAAEPEPMEYVRVCDAFGTGYFYIPGTETCLKIGGYIRVDFKGGDVLGQDATNPAASDNGDTYGTRTRAMLRFQTATDTEYGALKTYAQIEANRNNNTGVDTNLAHGYIEFAGLLIGYTDSLFAGGYIGGGYAANDYILVNYDGSARTQIRYTYGDVDNGFSFTAGLEDPSDASGLGFDGETANTYVPNVVGGLSYSAGGFQAFLVGGYDAVVEEGAIKGRINATFGAFSAFVMAGWNTDGDTQNAYAQWGGDWAVWLGAQYQATDKLAIYTDVNFMDEGVRSDGTVGGNAGTVEVTVGASYAVVPGFTITPEVVYVSDYSDFGGEDANDWGGFLRFQRSF